MCRRTCVLAAILTAATLVGRAQQATFRASVDLVTVDVTAIDGRGRPIPDLTADQFVLLVDGAPRRVVAAQFIGRVAASERLVASLPEHFTSNEYVDEGRLIVVAVDQQNIRPLEGTRALQAAARFVDALDPADRVGVASLSRVGAIEFTHDRRLARQRIQQLVGEADPVFLQFNLGLSEAIAGGDGNRTVLTDLIRRECGQSTNRPVDPARLSDNPDARDPCPEQIEQEARAVAQHARTTTTLSIEALRRIVDSLRDLPGPKTVVLLSEGLVAEPQTFDFGALEAAARAARVTMYVLQLDVALADAAQARPSPTQMADRQVRAAGLARLAGAGRGAVFELVGNDPAPFERIALELSGYYLVAFEAHDADRDGRAHAIRVTLARRGATIRARPSFSIPRTIGAPRAVEEQLVTILRTATLATELPVRVATFVCREPGSASARDESPARVAETNPQMVRAIVTTEADVARGTSGVQLGFVLRDERQIIVASGAQQSRTGGFAFSAIVPPGDYTLKVGAIDGLGRRGTVERSFGARIARSRDALGAERGPATSDLILAPVPQPPSAPLQPIVDRAPRDRMLAYLEMYPDLLEDLAGATVAVEIVRESDGAAVSSARATLHTKENGLIIARAIVPLGSLPAGRYVARATAAARGRPASLATRAFSIE